MSMQKRNLTQSYFLSKIHGIFALLDMGCKGEGVIENGLEVLV